MRLFENGLECGDVKKYTKLIGKGAIRDIIESMSIDYLKRDSDNEKLLIKYRLKDIINDIDKISLLSLITAFITPMVTNVFTENKMIIAIVLVITYVLLGYYIICSVKYYRCCKLYLDVIQDIEEGKIKIDGVNNYIILKFKLKNGKIKSS